MGGAFNNGHGNKQATAEIKQSTVARFTPEQRKEAALKVKSMVYRGPGQCVAANTIWAELAALKLDPGPNTRERGTIINQAGVKKKTIDHIKYYCLENQDEVTPNEELPPEPVAESTVVESREVIEIPFISASISFEDQDGRSSGTFKGVKRIIIER